jgi:hypothetical protein
LSHGIAFAERESALASSIGHEAGERERRPSIVSRDKSHAGACIAFLRPCINLKLRIENYTSHRETKDFIVEQAGRLAPQVREKPGVWYRLNRWREEQLTSDEHPT